MHGEFVKSYCRHYDLEIIKGVQQSYIVDGDLIIAEFKDNDSLISFCKPDGSSKTLMRKGDLLMCLIENHKLH